MRDWQLGESLEGMQQYLVANGKGVPRRNRMLGLKLRSEFTGRILQGTQIDLTNP